MPKEHHKRRRKRDVRARNWEEYHENRHPAMTWPLQLWSQKSYRWLCNIICKRGLHDAPCLSNCSIVVTGHLDKGNINRYWEKSYKPVVYSVLWWFYLPKWILKSFPIFEGCCVFCCSCCCHHCCFISFLNLIILSYGVLEIHFHASIKLTCTVFASMPQPSPSYLFPCYSDCSDSGYKK